MTEVRGTAGVIAPPPLIALGAVILGVLLDWLMPAYVLSAVLSRSRRITISVLLIAAGMALALAGRGTFVRFGTHVNPYKPSSVLVTNGIFAYVRNPMYVGLALGCRDWRCARIRLDSGDARGGGPADPFWSR